MTDGYYPYFYLLNLSLPNSSHVVATVGNTIYPVGTARPLYRTGVSLLPTERFLYI